MTVAALAGCGGGDGSSGDGEAGSSDRWPDVPVASVADGSEVSSADVLADGTTVVSLWATWCVPCKRELPMLEEMSADGTQVIGLNVGDSPDSVDTFLTDLGVTFPNYIDTDGELLSALDVPSLPATMIVVDGEIAWRNLGEVARDVIDDELAELAAQADEAQPTG